MWTCSTVVDTFSRYLPATDPFLGYRVEELVQPTETEGLVEGPLCPHELATADAEADNRQVAPM